MKAVFLAILFLLSPPLLADEGVLEKTAVAAARLNFHGVFFFRHDDKVMSFRIVHLYDQSGEHEKLSKLDGAPREIVRNNEDVQCYYPDAHAAQSGRVAMRRSFPSLLPEQLATLSANYTLKKGGLERVAGVNGQIYLLAPKDGLRYAHKFWIDPATDLLLRAEMLGDDGKVIEQTSFSEIAIGGKIDKNELKPTLAVKGVKESEQKPSGQSGWRANDLPAGFRKVFEGRRMFTGKPNPVTHIVYSDGIVSVSVFIEPLAANADKTRLGISKYGAVNLYAHAAGDALVTVVGEVPELAAMQIGNSMVKGN